MPEPREHADKRNWLETMVKNIPGFRGYLEKENRRDSDRLQRTWLADRLERSKRSLEKHSRSLADGGKTGELPKLDRVRGRLDKLVGRIRGGMSGYSGVFDLVDIDERALDRVYEYDVMLMDRVERLASMVEHVGGDSTREEKPAAIDDILKEFDKAEQAWDKREDLLKGLE
jgi:hypothetical protein